MFRLKNKTKNLVGVIFTDNKIFIAEINNNKNNNLKSKIKNLEQLELENYELINLSIFNSFKISKFIKNFIIKYNLENHPVVFCLDGSKLIENYNSENNCKNLNLNNCNCEFCVIYKTIKTNSDGFDYYCRINHGILFQYKLLAINIKLNLISIVTDLIAINSLLESQEKKEYYLPNLRENLKKIFSGEENLYILKQLEGISLITN